MKQTIQNHCTHRFTTRLSKLQFLHIKSQDRPSDYLRNLVERDIQVVQDEKS
jgi:hypothetical protein